MEELPKFVRQRLAHRAKPDSSKAPDALRGAVHPDANLLSAFAERSLREDERAAVLGHLADCTECRELVSLVFPAPEVQTTLNDSATSAKAPRRFPLWLGWRTLRWGVLAASIAVVMAGAFRSGILKWPAAPNTARNTVAENRPAASMVAPPSAASPAPSTQSYAVTGAPSAPAQGARPLQDKLADREMARSESLLQRGDVGGLAKQKSVRAPAALASQPAKEMEKSLARLAPPPPQPADERQYSAEQALKAAPHQAHEANKDRAALVANAVAANARAAAPVSANEPAATSRSAAGTGGGVAKTAPMERDLDQKSPRVSEAVQIQAQAVTPEKKADQLRDQSNAPNAQASPVGQAMAPPPQAPVAREQSQQGVASGLVPQATQEVTVTPQRAGAAAAPKAAKSRRARLSAYWSISAAGRIERSQAEGGPWSELHVDDSAKFQAVSAEGNDVWAGGSGGALYHSTDGGAHWTRVKIGPNQTDDQTAVMDDIVSLRFSDSEHGEVVTEAHERWITADGGAHWSLAQ